MVTAPDYEEMSWELSVQIDPKSGDESMKFKLRVKGDLHIGGLMLKLVEKISKCLGIHRRAHTSSHLAGFFWNCSMLLMFLNTAKL